MCHHRYPIEAEPLGETSEEETGEEETAEEPEREPEPATLPADD